MCITIILYIVSSDSFYAFVGHGIDCPSAAGTSIFLNASFCLRYTGSLTARLTQKFGGILTAYVECVLGHTPVGPDEFAIENATEIVRGRGAEQLA